jgi:hypothetical protein
LFRRSPLVQDSLSLRLLPLCLRNCTGSTERSATNRPLDAGVEDTVDVLLVEYFSCGTRSLLGQDTKKFLRTFRRGFAQSSLRQFLGDVYLQRLRNNRGLLNEFVGDLGTGGRGELPQQTRRDDRIQRSLCSTESNCDTRSKVTRFLKDALKCAWGIQPQRRGAETDVGSA